MENEITDVIGFEKQSDGDWYILSTGERRSMNDADADKLLAFIRAVYAGRTRRYLWVAIGYRLAYLRQRIVARLYIWVAS